MKQLYSSIILLVVVPNLLWSQDIKSLHKDLKNVKSDTARVSAMIKIGRWHLEHFGQDEYPRSADSTWYYAKKCEKLSKDKNLSVSLGKTYSFFGTIYSNLVNQEKAVEYEEKAINILKNTKDKKALCKAYIQLLHSEMQRVPFNNGSLEVAQKTLKLSQEIKAPFLEAQTLEIMGYYYNRTSEFAKAIDYMEKSIKIYKKLGKTEELKSLCSSIAVFYKLVGQPDKALKYNQEAIALLQNANEYTIEDSYIYGTLGDTYSDLGDSKTAILCNTKAWEIAKRYNNKNAQALSEVSLIDRLSETKQVDKARYHYTNIEKYINELDPFIKAHSVNSLLYHSFDLGYGNKANKYAKLSLDYLKGENQVPEITRSTYTALVKYYFKKKEYTNSKKYAVAFRDLASKMQSHQRLQEAYTQLYKIDSAQANYTSAFENFRLANTYKDSIFTEDKKKEIIRLETQFKTKEKENDNILLKKQAELQQSKLSQAHLMKNIGLAGIGILILAVALLYRRYLINKKIRKVIDHKNETLQHIIEEKEWLLKEIHHRVKNNLQVVMSLLNTQSHYLKDESAKKAIKNSQNRIHSMSLIHKKLYQSNNIVSVNMDLYIRELVEYLKESLDTGQRICFEIDAEPIELNSSQSVPLSLILNETIMNSIKHGFPDGREGTISILLKSLPENRIRLEIKDNGVGYNGSFEDLKASSSLGIKLILGFGGELNASVKFEGNSNGLTIILEFTNTNQSYKH